MEALVAVVDTQGKLEDNGAFNSDDDAESCPICLNTFRDQAVGTPENCAHYFCLDCIVEWSKVSEATSLWGVSFLQDDLYPLKVTLPAASHLLGGGLCFKAGSLHCWLLLLSPKLHLTLPLHL